ncbi:glyoxal oxidase N-terminus-domain-containing protein [Mycena pura]|uniref:Glyoxal oxidase N-terminus-domain-containing protein n=1 Tax=Mycena pura TaxID=153505 RepID=A0AAD6YB23_9AGAR|nr:glyoxal oxidase N-terminus-domain-containing protein [Mycena pura]
MFHVLVTLASLAHSALSSNVSSPSVLDPQSAFVPGEWSLVQQGTSGVSGMQLMIVTETTALIFDKVEHNPLMTENGEPAWTAELNLTAHVVRPLHALSNTWCATGGFLGNGTVLSTGGNPNVSIEGSGLQALRFFTPCEDATCDIWENSSLVHTASNRWYPGSVRIEDGSIGGAANNTLLNNANVNNPTYEFYPPKNINGFNGVPIPSPFLASTLNSNMFPFVIQLPDGTLFVAANQRAMIFNWQTNKETQLPNIPNGVRFTNPFAGSVVMLPLTPENHYTPEVVICGGNNLNDTADPSTFSSQSPTTDQCARLVLSAEGITAGWEVESMPQSRIMHAMVNLPDGRVVIVNGAQTGFSGTADHPVLTPVVYNPAAPVGHRFSSQGIPASTIPRMYHSSASLTPNGSILLAGSNPNPDVTIGTEFQTEYRLEYYSPAYLSKPRPTYSGLPATVNYNSKFTLSVELPLGTNDVTVALMDLGFSTHGVQVDQRHVKLVSNLSHDKKTLTVTGPPSSRIYPPGPAFLYVVTAEGVPSFGHKTIMGTGASPPVDQGAIDKSVDIPLYLNGSCTSRSAPTRITVTGSMGISESPVLHATNEGSSCMSSTPSMRPCAFRPSPCPRAHCDRQLHGPHQVSASTFATTSMLALRSRPATHIRLAAATPTPRLQHARVPPAPTTQHLYTTRERCASSLHMADAPAARHPLHKPHTPHPSRRLLLRPSTALELLTSGSQPTSTASPREPAFHMTCTAPPAHDAAGASALAAPRRARLSLATQLVGRCTGRARLTASARVAHDFRLSSAKAAPRVVQDPAPAPRYPSPTACVAQDSLRARRVVRRRFPRVHLAARARWRSLFPPALSAQAVPASHMTCRPPPLHMPQHLQHVHAAHACSVSTLAPVADVGLASAHDCPQPALPFYSGTTAYRARHRARGR